MATKKQTDKFPKQQYGVWNTEDEKYPFVSFSDTIERAADEIGFDETELVGIYTLVKVVRVTKEKKVTVIE